MHSFFAARMCIVGSSMGPFLHYWYLWLDKMYVGKAVKTVAKKVLVDQLVASPILGAWYFLGKITALSMPELLNPFVFQLFIVIYSAGIEEH